MGLTFNAETALLLCSLIAEGGELCQLCGRYGIPSYNIICRWRRENPDFNLSLLQAYQDKVESLSINAKNLRQLKKLCARQIGVRYPNELKPKLDSRRQTIYVNTGIHKIRL